MPRFRMTTVTVIALPHPPQIHVCHAHKHRDDHAGSSVSLKGTNVEGIADGSAAIAIDEHRRRMRQCEYDEDAK
ncbi:hypothetical protein M405DRAFT_298734 [Rhizopogon salebrosus TDB-379]|nr:hypothetical protein M405DRAFT_298734 [Rhizopogon salebrosus TDB-379]